MKRTRTSSLLVAVLGVSAVCGLALGEWTEPVPVTELNTEYVDYTPFLSFDGLTLYFSRAFTNSFYYARIFEATRQEPFGPFTSVSEVLKSNHQHVLSPWVSPDNLRMYYHNQIDSQNRWLLKVSERASVNDPWPPGMDLSELNQLGKIHKPVLTADELIILFASYDIIGGQGGYDIWMATRPHRNSPFGQVTNLAEINTTENDGDPFISHDGLTLYFQSNRNGPSQIFRATRESLIQPFGIAEHLSSFDTPGGQSGQPCISSDGTAFYFVGVINGQPCDIYVAYLIEDPYEIAIIRIEDAIAGEVEVVERIDAALQQEWSAYEAIEQWLETGDYGDFYKGDIVTAKQKIHSAIQHEGQQSIGALDKSVEKLKDALSALGREPEPPASNQRILALGGLEWTEPVPLTEVNSELAEEWTPFLSFDGLTLYFTRVRSDTFYYGRIFEATRQEPYGPFTSVKELDGTLNSSPGHVISPWVSPDNLRMYYYTESSGWVLKVTERASDNSPWPIGTNISELNALGNRHQTPRLTADELTIFFCSYNMQDGYGGYDIWMATRPDRYSPFGEVTNLSEINTASSDHAPFVSPDGLTLYFDSDRNGSYQLFRATRGSLNEPFGNIEHLSFFDTPEYTSIHPCISSDGTVLYFMRQLGDDRQSRDLWVSYLIEDPYQIAVIRIKDAIAQKIKALEKVDAALTQKWRAYEAIEQLLESGDYGNLYKGDIVTAMQRIHSSIQHEEQSKKAIDRSIEKLKDALAALGL